MDTFSQAEAEMATAGRRALSSTSLPPRTLPEITQAARKVAEAVRDGQIRPEDISEATLVYLI